LESLFTSGAFVKWLLDFLESLFTSGAFIKWLLYFWKVYLPVEPSGSGS
jgi:hypothetical protein